jgi:hypothetical protein
MGYRVLELMSAADQQIRMIFYVIDALDKFDAQAQQTLLRRIDLDCCNNDSMPCSPANFRNPITSRPYPKIGQYSSCYDHIDIQAAHREMDEDLRKVIRSRLVLWPGKRTI